MDPVVHFEMPYDDRTRVAGFYQQAFGWQTQLMGAEMGHYVLASTSEPGAQGAGQPGTINGGFFPRKPDWPGQQPSVVIAVKAMADAVVRVTGAGGSVMGEPMEIPGVGQYVSFLDTEGNRVGMLEPIARG